MPPEPAAGAPSSRTSSPASSRPSLASQQAALLSLITGRDLGAPPLEAASLVAGDARAGAEERVHVYAHMYRSRIVEALESQFPRLAKRLGADEFAELATAYIADEPSRQPSLRDVGARLPAWLAGRRPETPALAGLAALEWARADVFDLADDPLLALDEVRAWPPDRFGELPLALVTAHRLLTVAAGASLLWDGRDGLAAPGQEHVVVWRQGTTVYHRLLDEPERRALELCAGGTRFGVVCESLLPEQSEEAAIARAYDWMSTWLADGLLTASQR